MTENKKGSVDLGTASLIIALMPFVGRIMTMNMTRDKPAMSSLYHGYMVAIASALAITAIVMGSIVVIRALTRKEKKGLGFAIAGICIGFFQLAVFALATLFILLKH